MKKIIHTLITLTLLLLCNYFLSNFFNLKFLELSFMTGLAFSIIIGFFSSEGGITTEMTNSSYKRLMSSESRTKDHFMKFHFNIPFIVSLIYALVSLVASIIVYWKYFF